MQFNHLKQVAAQVLLSSSLLLMNTGIAGTAFASATGSSEAQQHRHFDAQEIRKIYYVLYSPHGSGQSMLGHAALRLGVSDAPSPNDWMVEFVADVESPTFFETLRALGIGEPISRIMTVSRYENMRAYTNNDLFRDLTNYELLFNAEQKNELIRRINQIADSGQFGDYSFLTANCSSALTELLKTAGVDLPGGATRILPTALPGLFKDAHLLGRNFIDYSRPHRRERLYQKYLGSLSASYPGVDGLKDSLLAPELTSRLYGFSRLLEELKSRFKDGQWPQETWDYLHGFIKLEDLSIHRALLAGTESFDVSSTAGGIRLNELSPQILQVASSAGGGNRSMVSIQKGEVEFDGQAFSLKVTLSVWEDSDFSSRSISFPLAQLQKGAQNALTWNGSPVGTLAQDGTMTFDGVWFFPEAKAINDSQYQISAPVVSLGGRCTQCSTLH